MRRVLQRPAVYLKTFSHRASADGFRHADLMCTLRNACLVLRYCSVCWGQAHSSFVACSASAFTLLCKALTVAAPEPLQHASCFAQAPLWRFGNYFSSLLDYRVASTVAQSLNLHCALAVHQDKCMCQARNYDEHLPIGNTLKRHKLENSSPTYTLL